MDHYIGVRSILRPDTSIKIVSADIARQHNETLLQILASESSTTSSNFYVQRQTYKIQLRIAYAAIFIGLIPFLFRRLVRERTIAQLVSLLVIVGIYGLDANLKDIDSRAIASDHVFAKAIDSLSNLNQLNTVWYNLDGKKLRDQFSQNEFEDGKRVYRKTMTALFDWDFEQVIFYLVPLLFISLFSIYSFLCERWLKKTPHSVF